MLNYDLLKIKTEREISKRKKYIDC